MGVDVGNRAVEDEAMNERFKNKYKIPSARAQWWDYSKSGAYFITICTAGKIPYFGDVIDGEMQMTTLGHIAEQIWKGTVNHAKNINLGEFIVMPNHIHGIIIINNPPAIANIGNNPSPVETGHALSLQRQQQHPNQHQSPGQSRFPNPGKNTISSIIGGYKSAVSRQCHKLGFDFAWQPRFHDHIIRNDAEYDRIAEYIVNNPLNWRTDTLWIN